MAHFLESRGQSEKALEIATEPDYKFELAVNLGRLDLALEFAEGSESEAKWKQLGELALSSGKLDVNFLPLYSSTITKLSSNLLILMVSDQRKPLLPNDLNIILCSLG